MAQALAEKLKHTGPAEKKRIATFSKKERNTAPDRKEGIQCQRSKENSNKEKKRDDYSSGEGQ